MADFAFGVRKVSSTNSPLQNWSVRIPVSGGQVLWVERASHALRPPRRRLADRYTLLRELGQGGMATVLGAIESVDNARPSVPAIAISPDGQTIVVAARMVDAAGERPSRVYRRRITDERRQSIPGTGSASAPFFDPSGRESHDRRVD